MKSLEIIALSLAYFLSLASVDTLTANVCKSCRKVNSINWEFLKCKKFICCCFLIDKLLDFTTLNGEFPA